MRARITALYRHPVKGFTPERRDSATLTAGACFPCDRLYAVENGPSGFDPAAPAHLSKMRFAVLAALPAVARLRTAYDEADGRLTAQAPDAPPFDGRLTEPDGRQAFAAWLGQRLGEAAAGPLRVLAGPGDHRFMDSRSGQVSLINLASVRDLAQRLGRPVDPLRFRANLYVDGWPAWAETDWTGRDLRLGAAVAQAVKPIVRCAATHVDPATGARDLDLVKALFDQYGHIVCGLYLRVTQGGVVREGDAAEVG